MVTQVLNEGARGMQASQREMVKAANEIARANIRPDSTKPESQQDTSTPLSPVEAGQKSEAFGDITEPLIELRRQELVFNASAKLVSTADKTLGTLLDTDA